MIEEFQQLYAYNRWANGRVLDATAQLSHEELTRDLRNSFPSIRDTLAHMLGAEWIWLSRWNGVSPTAPPPWDLPDHSALRARWAEVEKEQAEYVAALTPESLDTVIAYRTLSGDAFAQPLAELLRHVVNHATYHRGQITTMLRQLGAATVSTDLVQFYRG